MIGKVLTHLDALLDTRLGTLDRLDSVAALKAFKNPAYYTRSVDRFAPICGIDDTLYQGLWEARDTETLKHSLHTPVTDLLHYGLVRMERDAITDPTLDGVLLEVNVYPYQLTQAETHAFALAIAQCAGVHAGVRMIDESWQDLTVERCRDYNAMVLYDHHSWFKHHWETLIKRGMPQVSMIVPKLYLDQPIAPEMLRVEGIGEVDPWEQGRIPMLEYVGLEFVDVQHYCIAHPKVPLL